MRINRRRAGFEKLGSVRPDASGLPRREAQHLLLAHAWSAVAGRALAARVEPVRVIRGVLELEIVDHRWAREVKSLIPSLAGRLAGRFPDLGIRKMRLRIRGVESGAEAVAITAEAEGDGSI